MKAARVSRPCSNPELTGQFVPPYLLQQYLLGLKEAFVSEAPLRLRLIFR